MAPNQDSTAPQATNLAPAATTPQAPPTTQTSVQYQTAPPPPAPPKYSDAENNLLYALRNGKGLTDDHRQAIWDAYHSKDDQSFIKSVNGIDGIDDTVKQSVWNLRKYGSWDKPTPPQQSISPTAGAAPVGTPPPPPPTSAANPTSNGSSKWGSNQSLSVDKVTGTYVPQALSAIGSALNKPFSSYFGGQSATEAWGNAAGANKPNTTQGGVAGMIQDARKYGVQVPAGLVDFIQSPAGIAATFLEGATGGAATPWVAGLYTADAGGKAYEAYNKYKANPTADNLQDALASAAMATAISAGGKSRDAVSKIPTRNGPTAGIPLTAQELGNAATLNRSQVTSSGDIATPSTVAVPPSETTSTVPLEKKATVQSTKPLAATVEDPV